MLAFLGFPSLASISTSFLGLPRYASSFQKNLRLQYVCEWVSLLPGETREMLASGPQAWKLCHEEELSQPRTKETDEYESLQFLLQSTI